MLTFERVPESGSTIESTRKGCTLTFVPPMNASVLFGGGKDSDVCIYEHAAKKWTTRATGGAKKPTARRYHAAAFIESVGGLLVNGGQDQSGRCLQDFYLLSLRDWKWRKLIVVKYPTPRYQHSIIPISPAEAIIFGGISPYNEHTNDLWRLEIQPNARGDSISVDCLNIEQRGPSPQGLCLAESTVLVGDQLYALCEKTAKKRGEERTTQLYCFSFGKKSWKSMGYRFNESTVKILSFKPAGDQEETLAVLALGSSQRAYDSRSTKALLGVTGEMTAAQVKGVELLRPDQEWLGVQEGNLWLSSTGRLFPLHIRVQEAGSNLGSIQEYLIAIKHEQLLSQELTRKNSCLEELYKQMQGYITVLHRDYIRHESDPNIERQKQEHISDCQVLKQEYGHLDRSYREVVRQIKQMRGVIGHINEEFERCVETEYDDQS